MQTFSCPGKLGRGNGNSVCEWVSERGRGIHVFTNKWCPNIQTERLYVCVCVRGQRSQLWEEEVQTQHSQKWPLPIRVMWKSHQSSAFPVTFWARHKNTSQATESTFPKNSPEFIHTRGSLLPAFKLKVMKESFVLIWLKSRLTALKIDATPLWSDSQPPVSLA